jgi:glycosyltransferase involved in cell wall biosynthesis
MKVLHFISQFSLPSETFVYDFVKNQHNYKKYRVALFCLERVHAKERPLESVYTIKKFPRFYIRYFYRLFNLSLPHRVKNFLVKWEPDVIHIHHGSNAVDLYTLLKDNFYFPVVVSFNGTDVTSLPLTRKNYRESLLKIASLETCIFTVCSEFLKQRLCRLGVCKSQIFITYNTFNPKFKEKRKSTFFKKGDTLKIITVGRLTACKGHSVLIEAFFKFLQIYTSVTLTIIGGGELEEEIRQQIITLNLQNKVTVAGMVSHSQLPDVLAQHDVYVHPAIVPDDTLQEEAFGISILEAIAVGLPVIASRIGGIPEVIGEESQYAFLVPQKDPESIVKVLALMVSDQYEFSDNNIYAEERTSFFSMEKYMERMSEVYQTLMNRTTSN